MAQVNQYLNFIGSGGVAGGTIVSGMFVNAISGVINIYDGLDGSSYTAPVNTILDGFTSPAVGYYNLGDVGASQGVYVGQAAGSSITLRLKIKD